MLQDTERPTSNTSTTFAALISMSCSAGAAAQQAADAAPTVLEELIVTSSLIETPRRQIGTAVSVVSAEEIEMLGYDSIADVLRTQPGVGVSNSGGPGKATALRIRGEEGYRTLLIIDGVKAIDPTATQQGPDFSSLLATADMQRIEILRGPQGFMYGADAGGVVNVITRTGGSEIEGRVGLETGSFATRRVDASVAGGGDRGDYYISVRDLDTDGYNARTDDLLSMDEDGVRNTTLHGKFGWQPTDNLRLQLVARDIDASSMFDGCFLPVTFESTHACRANSDQTTARVSADWMAGMLSHSFGFSRIDIASDGFAGDLSTYRAEGDLSRLEYTGALTTTDATTLVYGLDLQDEKLTSGAPAERRQDGYYIEYQGEFRDRMFISAGARYDDNEDFGSHTSTRVSAAWLMTLAGNGTLKYRASYGTGFRAPSLFEVAYNRGPFAFPPASGMNLTEESSAGLDIGVEYVGAAGLHLEATYFDQQIDDEIYFDLTGFSGYLQSTGTSSSTGVELTAKAPIGERFEVRANLTHNDSEDTTNAQRLRRPEILANLGMLYSAADQRLRLSANYRVSRRAVDIGNVPLDDYQVLDLSLGYRLNETVEVTGRIENVTDEDYEEILGFNTADRSAYFGVRLAF